MRSIILISIMALITGCAGNWVVHETVKYGVNSQHSVEGLCLAGIAQGDGKYEIVIGKKGEDLQAWVERDGKIVESQFMGRRAFLQPYWPLKNPVALKKGTPKSLGLLNEVGQPSGKRWLLHVKERHRIVSYYRGAASLYGEENVTIAEGESPLGNHLYWVEIKANGKTWLDPCRGVFREHYQSYQPNSRDGKWVEQWRGSYREYRALAEKDSRTPEEIAANRAESHKTMALLGGYYWAMSPVKRYGPVPVGK